MLELFIRSVSSDFTNKKKKHFPENGQLQGLNLKN